MAVGIVGNRETSVPIEDEIASLMQREAKISADDIAERLGVSKRHVERLIR